jgi:hypothetical protein
VSPVAYVILAIVAAIIISGLSFYAGRLLFLLQKQKEKEQAFITEFQLQHEKKVQHTLFSIRTIASAISQEQCELSEGAIRICTLLDNFAGQELAYENEFPAFYKMFNKIKHLPSHQAYLDLAKQERMSQNMKRWQWEAEHKDEMIIEAKQLEQFQLQANS